MLSLTIPSAESADTLLADIVTGAYKESAFGAPFVFIDKAANTLPAITVSKTILVAFCPSFLTIFFLFK